MRLSVWPGRFKAVLKSEGHTHREPRGFDELHRPGPVFFYKSRPESENRQQIGGSVTEIIKSVSELRYALAVRHRNGREDHGRADEKGRDVFFDPLHLLFLGRVIAPLVRPEVRLSKQIIGESEGPH